MEGFLSQLTLAVTALNVLVAVALAARRVVVARRQRRLARAEDALRPVVLAIVDGEDQDLPPLDDVGALALSRLLRRYSRLLTGASRASIGAMASRSGLVRREREALTDRRSWRRATAAVMLGDLGGREDGLRLVKCLSDRSREVRSAAARSIGRLGVVEGIPRVARQMAIGRLPRALAAETLMTIGAPAADWLVRLLDSDAPEVRAASAELLGLVGRASHAPALATLLSDQDAEVRVKAARALGRVGGDQAVRELRQSLEDPVPYVRAAVARTLGVLGDDQSTGRLVEMAASDAFDPAKAAAEAVARLDPARLAGEVAARSRPGHLAEALDLAGLT